MSYPKWYFVERPEGVDCLVCEGATATGWERDNGFSVCSTCAGSLHRSVGERIKDRLVRRMERRAS